MPQIAHRAVAPPWLVADIGGTNARFGWVEDPARGVVDVQKFAVADFAGPAEAAQAYLAGRRPQAAAIAVATPVRGDEIAFTNSPWRFSRAALQQALELELLLALNDFEALALSLPRLAPSQWRAHGAPPRRDATLAVIGPGTGLGVGCVTPSPHGWVAVPGEGGHATLAPADDFESELLRHARARHGHVSAERLLSGIGLPALHAAVAAVLGQPAAELDPEDIVARALDGSDATCGRTVDAFCALLGGFAGNLALTVGARAGVFIGGGIVPRLGERFFTSPFRARFEAKGRFVGYMAAVPTALITDTLAALGGATLALEQYGR